MAGYVYFVRDPHSGLVKVGATADLSTRIKTLGGQFIYAVAAEKHFALEGQLHRKFSCKRVQGEWFDLNDAEMEDAVRGLPKLGPGQLPPTRYVSIKIDARLAKLAKRVAIFNDMTLAEYLSGLIRERVDKDFAYAVKELGFKHPMDDC